LKEKKMTKEKAKSPYHKDTNIPTTLVDELLQGCPPLATQEDLFGPDGVIKQLSKALIERCLEAELSTHLGYEKHERGTEEKTNVRNGFSRKKLKSEQGPVELAIPRDRGGSYDPLLVKKHQTSLTGFNEKILWMYAACGCPPAIFKHRYWNGMVLRSRHSSSPMSLMR
jgi:hypothetical protein